MILAKEAPELARVRASLRIEWTPYRSWVDRNVDRVNALADLAVMDGDEPAPILRANYVFECWMRSPIPTIYPPPAQDPTERAVSQARVAVLWGRALLTAALALAVIGCTGLLP